jgi:hypothetical protein
MVWKQMLPRADPDRGTAHLPVEDVVGRLAQKHMAQEQRVQQKLAQVF